MCASLLAACVNSAADPAVLENKFLKRDVAVVDGVLTTRSIENKLAKTMLVPTGGSEFRLRISDGTDKTGTDVELTAADFAVKSLRKTDDGMVAELSNAEHGLDVEVLYTLAADEPFARKQLKITSAKPVTIERIDLEALAVADAHQPYTLNAMNARGKWSVGLGQPLYTTESATFWGVEFPAARNTVEEGALRCGYQWGRELKAGESHTTYKAVVGVGDDPAFISDAFMDYIDAIRVRPLRLQVQYNSWFDFSSGVSRERFAESVKTIHEELVEKRGCRPLNAYVIDDGWQKREQALPLWEVNEKFDPDFSASGKLVGDKQSTLGLWLSPGCLFGAKKMVPHLREAGFEALEMGMSMCGPKYMSELEQRVMQLVGQGVQYFKFDGSFGHRYIRDFELNGRGCPAMPQLELDGLKANDPKLNNPKYNELKTYYMVAGTERLIEIFTKMAKKNPDIFIAITNGAYLSPWWLQHIDVVWMINAGDAAGGSGRTGELIYRDSVYYEIWKKENTQFPMSALFNHEPKKTKTGESADTFRDYLFMNLSRGTGFIELYVKTAVLSQSDWDVMAEGLKWSYDAFPAFRRVRMHGGNPRVPVKGEFYTVQKKQKGRMVEKKMQVYTGEVYGYSAWSAGRGYISFHNPGDEAVEYSVTLDRAFGLLPGSGPFKASSPLPGGFQGLEKTYKMGDTLTLTLKPKEIRLIDFKTK